VNSIYANPREGLTLDQCYFYHTMDIPGIGTVEGEWDIRGREREYLGHLALSGKRVLEMGTASGFLCFYMEQQGAQVVAYDLSEKDSWDIVPYGARHAEELAKLVSDRRRHIALLNNGYWYAHKALNSRARVVYGSVYEVPQEIGPVDIVTFTSILLHVRDPFLAMARASRLARESLVVTEMVREQPQAPESTEGRGLPYMRFLPDAERLEPWETWWSLTPQIVCRFAEVLGFGDTSIQYFEVPSRWRVERMFSVVAHR
jgi:hypothetical protein